MAWLKWDGRLGAAACRTVEPLGWTSKMLQWQPLEASLTRVHNAFRTVGNSEPRATISSNRFSPASKVSARFRSSMSVFWPYHFTTRPLSSYNGTARIKNHRKVPSDRRKRASTSPGSRPLRRELQ